MSPEQVDCKTSKKDLDTFPVLVEEWIRIVEYTELFDYVGMAIVVQDTSTWVQ